MAKQNGSSKDKSMRNAIIIAAIITGFFAIIAAAIQAGWIKPWWINGEPPTKIKKEPSSKNEPSLKISPGTNILVLNACNSTEATIELYKLILKNSYKLIVDVQDTWDYRYEMQTTRIYYILPKFKKEALIMEEWLPRMQHIIDYQNQEETNPPEVFSTMYGLEKRDLVIFLGNDYHKVLKAI